MSFATDLSAIEKTLKSATLSAQQLASATEELNALKNISPVGSEEHAKILKLIDVTRLLKKERNEATEQERRNLEQIMGNNKTLITLVEKLAGKHKHLANTLYQSAKAWEAFTKSADLGKTIAHVGALTPYTKAFGTVLGFAANAAIKAQDRVQAVNKSIIDLSASTGHFGEGMEAANKSTLAITTGFAAYAQQTGIASDKLQSLAGDLGKVGFTMEEMGIDKQTGRISTLSSAVSGNSKQWGTLSVALGVARATGLDQGAVVSQLQTQIKTLGGSVEGTVKTFGALSIAANRSRLSTSTLLPIVRDMQGSFQHLGIDSAKAAEMLGRAGEVAAKSGTGAATAVATMSKAISGMAQMDFGQMAFMGQQMGMGGGLSAGFQFRKQIGGEGGAGIAQQIGQVVGKLMGGTGDLISEEQAAGNEQLASIRLGQEKLAQQMLGLSANESRVFINMTKELEGLNSAGEGDSDRAKELNKEINKMSMSENAYRAKTLTGQEKIQNLLQLISALVGRAVSIFIRAFAGGAAASGDFGKDITKLLGDIGKGEGLDNITDRIAGISDTFEKTMGPTIEKMGNFMGKHWLTTLGVVFGGSFIFDIRSTIAKGISGIFGSGLGEMAGNLLSSGIRGILKMFRTTGNMGGTVMRDAMGMIIPAAKEASGVMRFLTMGVGEAAKSAGGGLLSAGKGLLGLVGAINPVTIGIAALGIATYAAVKIYEDAALERLKNEEKITAAANRFYMSIDKVNKVLEKKSGISSQEAYDLVKKVRDGRMLTEQEKKLWKERKDIILQQAREDASKKFHAASSAGAKSSVLKEASDVRDYAGQTLDASREAKYGIAGAMAPSQARTVSLQKIYTANEEDAWRNRGNQAAQIINSGRDTRKAEEAKKEEAENKDTVHKVVISLDDEILKAKVEKGVRQAAEKDIVAPGKSGQSANRHGVSYGY